METLNDDCFNYIFEYLEKISSPKEMLSYKRVCSNWNRLLSRPWRMNFSFLRIHFARPNFAQDSEIITVEELDEILIHCARVTKEFDLHTRYNVLQVIPVIDFGIDLYRYQIVGQFSIIHTLDRMAELYHNIETITVKHQNSDLYYPSENIKTLIDANQRLLNLSIMGEIPPDVNNVLPNSLPTCLENLVFHTVYAEFDDTLYECLTQPTQLKSIDLERSSITVPFFQSLRFQTQLKTLRLRPTASVMYPNIVLINQLTNLTKLDLERCNESLTDGTLTTISSSCIHIRDLGLAMCSNITGIGVNNVVHILRELKILRLKDLQIRYVTESAPSTFETLIMEECPNLSIGRLCTTIETSQHLRYLNIDSCFQTIPERVVHAVVANAISRNFIFEAQFPLFRYVVVRRENQNRSNTLVFKICCEHQETDEEFVYETVQSYVEEMYPGYSVYH